jgi:hypothetical protein
VSAGSVRKRRRAWRVAGGVLAGLVVAELFVRWLLFVPTWPLPGCVLPLVAWARRPGLWADSRSDDLYWSLQQRWTPRSARVDRAPRFDAQLGWSSTKFHPPSYWHTAEEGLADRRPLLLYGGTFVLCNTLARDCFQGLMRRSSFDPELFLLNYGVDGYGLDQTYLLLQRSLGLYAERDPLVVLGILVDDELDRTVLTFRRYSKPRLAARPSGALPDVPAEENYQDWLAARGPIVPSFLWRGLVHRFPFLPEGVKRGLRGERGTIAEKQALVRSILAGVRTEAESRSLEYFVLLLHGHYSAHEGPWSWQEPFLTELLDELGMPYVSVRRDLHEVATVNRLNVPDLFDGTEGPGMGYYTALGNQAAFAALERGLRGEFDGQWGRKR